jgi:hypothetical protein
MVPSIIFGKVTVFNGGSSMWRISDAELDRMLDDVLRELPLVSLRQKILLDLRDCRAELRAVAMKALDDLEVPE